MKKAFKKIVIVGVGLIGGSIGLAVRKKGLARSVVGIDPDRRALTKAVLRKAIHRFEADPRNYPEAVKEADLLILCTPVGRMLPSARALAPHLSSRTVVTDVGSVKAPLIRDLEPLFSACGGFVGSHPIAGRESSGVEAAAADLFSGSVCLVTPTNHTRPRALATVRRFWKGIGARTAVMDAQRHDQVLGAVSHLPHVIAYALVNTILAMEEEGRRYFPFAGGGLKDFTRVAASSPEMWRDICLANRDQVIAALELYEKSLERIKRFILEENAAGLQAEFERARVGKKRSQAS